MAKKGKSYKKGNIKNSKGKGNAGEKRRSNGRTDDLISGEVIVTF